MKKIATTLGLLACLPFVAFAQDIELDEELNGLDIETKIIGDSTATTPGPGGTAGTQVLQVTNNGDSSVTCQLDPGPAETAASESPMTPIKAGASAVLRLDGSYASATMRAKLICNEEE
ncbi:MULTISPECIES: hypothetical protein [Pseudomonadaceae]|uniref:Uncharacterized protein n=1 Tax=Halopseudomonas litoralis TaxID=797277 RepID=A0A1H1W5P7_9GAMM|nr:MULTISPECIES: hypothetical protein [Pseudomonadaceae]SDS92030.1 hypothetical protein SAMN05216198_3148 [Halopseudomonas litoralis]